MPVAIALLWLAAALLLMPSAPVMMPDSAGYIHFAAERTPGYPLFLTLFGVRGALSAQPIIAALALAALGWQTARLTGSVALAAVLMLAIGANPFLFAYNYMILTESLFVSLSMLVIAALMRAAASPSLTAIALVSLIAGVASTVRPVGAFLPPAVLLFVLLLDLPKPSGLRRVALAAAAVLPFLGVIAFEHAALPSQNGESNLLLRDFYAKAALIDAPAAAEGGSAPSKAADVLANTFAPVRAIIGAAPNFATRAFLTVLYEHCINQAAGSAKGCMHVAPDLGDNEMRDAALSRLASNPLGYLALTWLHYRAAWTIYTGQHLDPKVAVFIDEHQPLPFQNYLKLKQEASRDSLARLAERPVWMTGILTLLLALFGIAWRLLGHALTPPGLVATTSGFAAHCGVLVTAMTAVGVPRYTIALWPFMAASLVCGLAWLLERAGPKPLRDWAAAQ